jgi:hypothetical protein
MHGRGAVFIHRFGGKARRKQSLGRPRSRLEGNFKIVLRWSDMDRIYLAEDSDQWRTFVNTVMNLHIS